MSEQRDGVDVILEQWCAERPELDHSPIGVVGRVSRLARELEARLEPVYRAHGLEGGWYDVLTLPGTNTELENFNGESCDPSQEQPLIDALTISCNTAFAQLGMDLGEDKIREMAEAFGMDGETFDIPLQVEASGLVPEDRTKLSIVEDTTNTDPYDGNGTHVDVLFRAHHLRVERGDHHIDREHLADAIEQLTAESRPTLSEDRSPKDPYS